MRHRYADSLVLRAAGVDGRRPQDADAAKEKNHKRRGAARRLRRACSLAFVTAASFV